MTSLPLTEARNRLSELVEDVERTHERVTITRHGEVAAVMLSPDDLAALEETLDVLGSPDVMRQLSDSKQAVATGDVLGESGLAALMAERERDA